MRMQQEVQVQEGRLMEEIPQKWRQTKKDKTEKEKEVIVLMCTLLNGSAWSTFEEAVLVPSDNTIVLLVLELRNAAECRLTELFLSNARFAFTGVLGPRLPLAELFIDASGAFDEQTEVATLVAGHGGSQQRAQLNGLFFYLKPPQTD